MARQHLTMRLNGRTLETLDRRAREVGLTRSRLAERYIEEGLRMDRHPGIVFWQRPAGREAMLAGSRLSVLDVIFTFRDNDNSSEVAADYLGKPLSVIETALGYYADHKDEVDAWIEEYLRFADQEEEAWRSRQGLLA